MDKRNLAHIKNAFRVAAIFLLFVLINHVQICIAGQPKALPQASVVSSNANLNELEQLIDNAEDIYEKAKVNRWKHLDKKINSIVKTEQILPGMTSEKDMPYYKNLIGVVSDLERAIVSQDRLIAMKSANKVMMLGARLAEAHNSPIPINVAVIGYYGRKLEVQSETEGVTDLSDTVTKLHLSWQQLIPLVTAYGGIKEVKRFAEIMKRLESAKKPDEYGKLASSVVDEVYTIEKIFKK
ncbi:hypothetical protein [Geobacter sp. AOG2]|uniref:hypothetical protein n=1 Tax=Geobacter sp. AOG2 TaxID=1566347 RepID=UPI001CC6488F|nr:hypothetical protein [Geobacter sp. AOG2]GFE61196.1 hypothetical protein AOG2_17830 [Geobacter sp. AOG2]